eukprot:gnl/MRDRNA2_/MRDRNA2_22911_c0_seq1.p1 gnl/MRDRNA2_/MRDRNA2_22911_c0~~gnl/MRDRNA2_/MRDRNA2_22911_c0_seq1.p1  ORF type:complete len:167 (+),score=15.83 gnl/MRDRNA2_/MRDRNA2_22911_c0_seq1:170-670(+)
MDWTLLAIWTWTLLQSPPAQSVPHVTTLPSAFSSAVALASFINTVGTGFSFTTAVMVSPATRPDSSIDTSARSLLPCTKSSTRLVPPKASSTASVRMPPLALAAISTLSRIASPLKSTTETVNVLSAFVFFVLGSSSSDASSRPSHNGQTLSRSLPNPSHTSSQPS